MTPFGLATGVSLPVLVFAGAAMLAATIVAAVLTAMRTPELLRSQGGLYLSIENARLAAVLVAIALAGHLQFTFVTIVCGLAPLHLAQWLLYRA